MITITVPSTAHQNNFPWLDDKFVGYQELFPDWEDAYEILCDICKLSHSLVVKLIQRYEHTAYVVIFGLSAELGGLLLTTEKIPKQHAEKIQQIITQLERDYSQGIERFIGKSMSEHLLYNINQMLKALEYSIIASGGRELVKELKFRLGVSFLN